MVDHNSLEALYGKTDFDEDKFPLRLGSILPQINKLKLEVFSCFSEKDFGISWWKCYKNLNWKKRVLISDHLWQSLATIQTNMTEAKLHLDGVIENWNKEEEAIKKQGMVTNEFGAPKRESIQDQLPLAMAELHFKGFLSSLCSSLDCLAAVEVGILGIPLDIFKVDYPGLKNFLKTKFNSVASAQKKKVNEMAEVELKAGPNGWVKWLYDYRNMMMHRGPRVRVSGIHVKNSGVLDNMGRPIPTANVVKYLTKDPAISEIESLKDGELNVLSESAEITLNELHSSVRFFLEESAKNLIEYWKLREENPDLVVQPEKQWPKIRNSSDVMFGGYSPNLEKMIMEQLQMGHSAIKRLKCSSLLGDELENWKK